MGILVQTGKARRFDPVSGQLASSAAAVDRRTPSSISSIRLLEPTGGPVVIANSPADGVRRFVQWDNYLCGVVASSQQLFAYIASPDSIRGSNSSGQFYALDSAARMPASLVDPASDDLESPELFQPEPIVVQGLMLFTVGDSIFAVDVFANAAHAEAKVVLQMANSCFLTRLLLWGAQLFGVIRDENGVPQVVKICPATKGGTGVISLAEPWTFEEVESQDGKLAAELGPRLRQGTFAGPVAFLPFEQNVLMAVPNQNGSTWKWAIPALPPTLQDARFPTLPYANPLGSEPNGVANTTGGQSPPRLMISPRVSDGHANPVQASLNASSQPVITQLANAAALRFHQWGDTLYGAKALPNGRTSITQLGLSAVPIGGRASHSVQNVTVLQVMPAGENTVLFIRDGSTLQIQLNDRFGIVIATKTIGDAELLSPPANFGQTIMCLCQVKGKPRALVVELVL